MSSQGVEVSSSEEYTDPINRTTGQKQVSMLHPNWTGANREIKNKAKSTCGSGFKIDSQVDQNQIQYYKEKAHQSFMQVIQVQQLHDEEIQQLKEEYQTKINQLEIQLKLKNQTIDVFERNSRHHILDMQKNLEIEGLEPIQCKETNLTRFDQSTILSFKEFLSEKEGDAKIESMREAIFKSVSTELSKSFSHPDTLLKNIKKQINCIFEYVKQVRQQLLLKVQSHEMLLKRYEQMDIGQKKLKARYQLIQKDAIIMSQNLQRLKQQKIQYLEKINEMQNRVIELEKELRIHHNSKENIPKMSIKDVKNPGLVSSNNILTSFKSIGFMNGGKSKLFKSQKNLKETITQQDNTIVDQHKINDNSHHQNESFDMKDLIAEINENPLGGTQYSKMQKKTQKYIPIPLTTRQRKKSFDN